MPLDCYKGKIRATFTMCIENSKPAFVERVVVDEFVDVLTQAKDKYNCINWVYIFMPDHLHLILEGKLENADLWKAMVLFKQKTGFWLSKNKQVIKWQKDFYDHIHRKDEDLKKHIRYILDNPVRKGIVNKWEDYEFKGSLDFDLEKILM